MNRFLDALGIAALLALLLLVVMLATPARSQPTAPETRMSLLGPAGTCFAVIVIENRAGGYHADEKLQTDRGAVVVNYTTVGGHNAQDADLVAVVSLPDGVMADPMQMALPDGDTGRICLMEWLGG